MGITRERLDELEAAERKLKLLQRRSPKDEIEIEDYGRNLPAKMLPPEKKGLFGRLRKKKPDKYARSIKEKVTEESPEIMFQRWLQKKCRRNCHVCEDCVLEIETIINS